MQNQVVEGFRLSPQQRRLWPLQQGSSSFHTQCALLIEGRADRDLLKAATERVVNRHEIFRTNFLRLPGMDLPIQVVAEGASRVARDRLEPSGMPKARLRDKRELF